MWSQFTAASHIGSITAALLCLVSAPTCGRGGGEYMAHIPKQQLIIMPISPTITFRKTICWPGMHDTLNSLPSWIQFLIHVLCFAGFVLPIRDVRASVGAGFLYPLVGTVCVFFNIFHYISSLQLLFGLVTTCSLGGCVLHDKYKAICSGLYCTLLHLLVVLRPLWSNER